jgi:hypothetical protein
MSKAIAGAAMLGGAIGMSVLAVMDPVLVASPIFDKAIIALAMGGISMEAGAVAQALTQQRGMNITTRQPAQYRQIVYGTQRVGGVMVFESTTGSKHDQYNIVIVLATHVIQAIENLYLDGRQVFWNVGSTGNTTRNGYNFGGSAGGGTHIGPSGQHYNFDTLVYCEAKFGDQVAGDVIGGLTANDPNWAAGAAGSPYLGGCAYVYLKVEYDTAMFSQFPEIRFTVHGKSDILDPRTGRRGYSTNPALIVGDIISDPTWGLGDESGNQAQLIAAANICDETLACAPTTADPTGSLTEARYSGHWHYDTSTPPGEAIKVFLEAMGGRLTRSGGEWYIWPAAWVGPSASWDQNALLEPPQWNPFRTPDALINRVTGTYIAPNSPYNIAGDLYDANGWYEGSIQNNFPFAFQPDNFPQYAQDSLHGYATDLFLNQDSGASSTWDSTKTYADGDVVLYGSGTAQIFRAIAASTNVAPFRSTVIWNPLIAYTSGNQVNFRGTQYTALGSTTGDEPDLSPSLWQPAPWIPYANQLPLELELKAVLSVAQAQRLAKIKLLRNRQQGMGMLKMKLAAYTMQAIDTFHMTFPQLGWTSKVLEVSGEPQFTLEDGEVDEQGRVVKAPSLAIAVPVQETDPSIYAWDISEELTVYDVPSTLTGVPYTPVAPTSMTLDSGSSTAVVGLDGVTLPRVLVEWTDPEDVYVTQIQIEFRLHGASTWSNGPVAAVGLGEAFVSGVVAAQAYDFRIRSLRSTGATSDWLEADNYTVSTTLSTVLSTGINPNSPYNLNNDATIDSIIDGSGTAAEIRVYGPSGVGTAWDNYTGQGAPTYPAGSISGLAFTTVYWVVFDQATSSYLAVESYNDALSDSYVNLGWVETCASGGTGGGSGGGGGTGGPKGGGPRGNFPAL